jgi:hypothetical protein
MNGKEFLNLGINPKIGNRVAGYRLQVAGPRVEEAHQFDTILNQEKATNNC